MATFTLKKEEAHTIGDLPKVGEIAPNFVLTSKDLKEVLLENFAGKRKILNIFPSLDTPVCSISIKTFYKKAEEIPYLEVLNISKDLPFAATRFCGAEGLSSLTMLSAFRSSFGQDYGVEISDGALQGLFARAVIVLDEGNRVLYAQLAPELTSEPDYEAPLAVLQ